VNAEGSPACLSWGMCSKRLGYTLEPVKRREPFYDTPGLCDFALVGATLAVAFVICLLSKLDQIVVGLNAVKDELESIHSGIESMDALDAASTGDIEALLERICGALGGPPDVRPMVRALTSLRDAIDKPLRRVGRTREESAERAVVTAKLWLDQSIIPCPAQGELQDVVTGMIQARNERADTSDPRAKIELAISVLSTASSRE
jgi:hypothetical protein